MIWGVFPLFLETTICSTFFPVPDPQHHSTVPRSGSASLWRILGITPSGSFPSRLASCKVTHTCRHICRIMSILDLDVSKNRVFSPKSSILMGFSIIFTIHFGVPLFLETLICWCYMALLQQVDSSPSRTNPSTLPTIRIQLAPREGAPWSMHQ